MGVCCNIWSALGQVHGYFGTIRQLAITWSNVEQFPGAVCHMTPKQPLPIPGLKESTNVATNKCMSSINCFQQNTQPQLFKHWSRKSPPKLLISMMSHCWVKSWLVSKQEMQQLVFLNLRLILMWTSIGLEGRSPLSLALLPPPLKGYFGVVFLNWRSLDTD